MLTKRLRMLQSAPISMRPRIAEQADAAKDRLSEERSPKSLIEIATQAANAFEKVSTAQREKDQPRLACASGCSACCHQKVEILAPEAIRIVDFLRSSLESDRFQEVESRIRHANERTYGLGVSERLSPELPCPLLEDGSCSIYEVRPLTCRGATSFSAEECNRALHDPVQRHKVAHEGAKSIPVYTPQLLLSSAFRAGMILGLDESGLASYPLELNAALVAVLDRPTIGERWLKGAPAFAQSRYPDD